MCWSKMARWVKPLTIKKIQQYVAAYNCLHHFTVIITLVGRKYFSGFGIIFNIGMYSVEC